LFVVNVHGEDVLPFQCCQSTWQQWKGDRKMLLYIPQIVNSSYIDLVQCAARSAIDCCLHFPALSSQCHCDSSNVAKYQNEAVSNHMSIEYINPRQYIALPCQWKSDQSFKSLPSAIKSIMEIANSTNHHIHVVNPTGDCPNNQSIRRLPHHVEAKLVNHFIRLFF
jgi:hypothetical protein